MAHGYATAQRHPDLPQISAAEAGKEKGEKDKVSTYSCPKPRSAPTPVGRRPLWATRLEGLRLSLD